MERLQKHQGYQCPICNELFEDDDELEYADMWACPECGEKHSDEYDAVACCLEEDDVDEYCRKYPGAVGGE